MKAYMIGSGIGSLAAAAFMIRDGGVPGSNITIYERLSVLGGCLDGARLAGWRLFASRRPHADHRPLRMHLGPLAHDPVPRASRQNGPRRNRSVQRAVQGPFARPPRRRNRHKSTSRPWDSAWPTGWSLSRSPRHPRRNSAPAASRTGSRRPSSRPTSGTCGRPRLPSSPGTAPSSSSAICTGS